MDAVYLMPEITVGTWKTRDGRKAHVVAVVPPCPETGKKPPTYCVIGYVAGEPCSCSWTDNGVCYGGVVHALDLIEPWREPVTKTGELVMVRYPASGRVALYVAVVGIELSGEVIARKVVTITEGEGMEQAKASCESSERAPG